MSATSDAEFQVDAPPSPAERPAPRPATFNPGSWRPAPAQPDGDHPRNVIEAIARVMREMPGVGKDSRADPAQGGYAYRGIEAITAGAQRLLGRYGVVFVLRELDMRVEAITVNSKPWTDTYLTCEYVVHGPGGAGDCIVVGPIHAIGRDNSDKGPNKARTQALKAALVQTLLVGDSSSDADQGSPEADRSSAAERAEEARDLQARDLGWSDGVEMDTAHRQLIDSFRQGGEVHAALGAEGAREAWKECPRRPMDRAAFDGYTDWLVHRVAEVGAERPQEAQEAPGDPQPTDSPEGAQDRQEPAGAAPAASPPLDVSSTPADVEAEKRADDERREVQRLVTDMVSDATAEVVDAAAAEVKVMHHAVVDRRLKELGWPPEGSHIESRRMMLTAVTVRAVTRPTVCVMFDCDQPRQPGEDRCADHAPL